MGRRFHAVVARNLTKHPLKFTLYDQPWLPYNYKGWGENHIWLHKPPVAMWSIWVSHLIFGINTFALRLPSAISLVVTTWLTFRIAADLFDKRTGLIAAFLQAFNPFLFESIHGYRYSDHIDIALLLWVQVSCWFLLRAVRTGKRRNYILSGVAMGIAYLSKSYLALITFGIALVVWGVAWYTGRGDPRSKDRSPSIAPGGYTERDGKTSSPSNRTARKIKISDIGIQLLAAIATVAPWVIYCLIYYRKEFLWEHKRVLDHLNTDVESWGASWDRPLFDYMPLFYPLFYAALVAAVLCLLVVMFRRWHLSNSLCWRGASESSSRTRSQRRKHLGNNDCCATVIDLSISCYQSSMATQGLGLYRNLGSGDACDYRHLRWTHPRQEVETSLMDSRRLRLSSRRTSGLSSS